MSLIKMFSTFLLMTLISFSATAQCSASTSCGDYTFDECNSISVSEQSVNGEASVTITVDGVVVVEETCTVDNGGEPGEPGEPGNGDFDICDYIDCESICDMFGQYGISLPFCE